MSRYTNSGAAFMATCSLGIVGGYFAALGKMKIAITKTKDGLLGRCYREQAKSLVGKSSIAGA